MRGKAKRCLLSSLVVLLVVPLLGCGFLENLMNPPALTRQQAVALVVVVGVPYLDDYIKETMGEEEAQAYGEIGSVTPTGDWDANYQGEGEWEVQGPVTTEKWGECLTTWTLSEADSKMRLTGLNCD